MEYPLSEEHRLLRDTMRRFVDEELIPVEMETCDGEELKPEYREKFSQTTDRSAGKFADRRPIFNQRQSGPPPGVLRGAREKGAEGDIIGTGLAGLEGGVFGIAGRKADHRFKTNDLAGLADRHIPGPQMHPAGPQFGRQPRMVIYDKGDFGRLTDWHQHLCGLAPDRLFGSLKAQLQAGHIAAVERLAQLFGEGLRGKRRRCDQI